MTKGVIVLSPYSVSVRIPSRNSCAKLVSWTGGSEPDSYWNMPLEYREIVGGLFRDMVSMIGGTDKDTRRILWNRAKLDGWKTWSAWIDTNERSYDSSAS